MMAKHRERFRWRELITRSTAWPTRPRRSRDMERLAVVKALIRP